MGKMNPTFSGCAFKLVIPTCSVYEEEMKIKFKFIYEQGNTEKIVFVGATHTNKVKQTLVGDVIPCLFEEKKTKIGTSCKFNIVSENKKIFVSGSFLSLEFWSDNGEKTFVSYLLDDKGIARLYDVHKGIMNEQEKSKYEKVTSYNDNPITDISEGKEDGKTGSINIEPSYLPAFQKYINALKEEKLYLMLGGGKKYKVTNGKLISKDKGIYSYLFDLEAELYIADDSPIKITTGMENSSGTVLMCEDFQIIVQLESNIGQRVLNAIISVEPWKLLEALEKRLRNTIGISGNIMAEKIMKQGPGLATTLSINKIPKGQDAVIERAMKDPVTIVWGPPGTGKTHTMSELAIRFMDKGYSVLIVSHSNVSVDGVAKKIDELLRNKGKTSILKKGKVLRYGYVRDEQLNKNPYVNSFYYSVKKSPLLSDKLEGLQDEYDYVKKTEGLGSKKIIDLKKEIGKIRAQIREQEQYYVSKAKVVATTISKIVIDKHFEDKKYDVVMFDEVSMAYVLQVIAAATFATKHMICVGDFMQLAPIAQSKAQNILCEDIFSYLGINKEGTPFYHPWLVMLDEQRRMHPKISGFANKYVYKKMLKNHPSTYTSREEIVQASMFNGFPINMVDMTTTYCAASKNADNSRYNILSALVSFSIAVHSEMDIDSVSIITPYAAQTRLIRALVLDYRQKNTTEIRCSTVHQFQGSESDIVIFDAVESYPAKKPGWLMGKDYNSILRLINVAVTRARGKFVTIAHGRFWDNNYVGTSHTLHRLISYSRENGNIVKHADGKSLEKLVPQLSLKNGPLFTNNIDIYMDQLEKDISSARNKIVVSLPSGSLNPTYASKIEEMIKKAKQLEVMVLAKCNEYSKLPENWKSFTWETTNATFPIILIDDHILWYGVPLADWKFKNGSSMYLTACPIVCRIDGEHTAEIIKSLSDLEFREMSGNKKLMKPKDYVSELDEGNGLADYVKKNIKCESCHKPIPMTKGKSGKTILWCKDCKKTQLLTPDVINHYICVKQVKCPVHKCDMQAKVGKYGLYIKCDAGHNMKPEDI